MVLFRIILAASVFPFLVGCGTTDVFTNASNGEPIIDDHVWLMSKPSTNGSAEVVDALNAAYVPTPCQVKDDKDYQGAAWQKSATINACVYAMLNLIDVRFCHYEDSLLAANSEASTFADLSVVGMGAAGGLVGGATSQILNAASSALTGAKGKIDNDVLYTKSINIIVQQMEGDRAKLLTTILGNIKTNNYNSMYAAANDLYAYARAGSWTHAIQSLEATTGQNQQNQTDQANMTRAQ